MEPEERSVSTVVAQNRARILVVDDEDALRRAMQRILERAGYEVVTAANGREAIRWLDDIATLDAIVSDLRMPEMNGLELLRAVRSRDLDLPVLLVTAAPDVASAIEAIDFGAYKYIPKPVDHELICESVQRAVALRRMARVKREGLALLGQSNVRAADRAGLESSFDGVLRTLWMAYQPIVHAADGTVFGYEALLRANEPSLPHPGAILDAAERLDRLPALGRAVRAAAAAPMAQVPGAVLFVNLHTRDLADETLFSAESPLARIAPNVILEITERASLDEVSDVRDRVARLRAMGFRLAVDDLGAGYAGLTSFATLEPEIIKLDMSLVRDVDTNPVKRRVVGQMTTLAHDLHVLVVAEGVETLAERNMLVSLGCDLLQGYLLAKPGKPFPSVSWPA
jgi:EAL domain-containing protein (putative c-di-GMP-specific phosphodiesterase class I)